METASIRLNDPSHQVCYPDQPSDHGDFTSPHRCVECGDLWPCAEARRLGVEDWFGDGRFD